MGAPRMDLAEISRVSPSI